MSSMRDKKKNKHPTCNHGASSCDPDTSRTPSSHTSALRFDFRSPGPVLLDGHFGNHYFDTESLYTFEHCRRHATLASRGLSVRVRTQCPAMKMRRANLIPCSSLTLTFCRSRRVVIDTRSIFRLLACSRLRAYVAHALNSQTKRKIRRALI